MTRTLLLSAFVLSTTVACGESAGPPVDVKVVAEAQEVWDTRCVTCHGSAGNGNGPGAKALAKKPRSFRDPIWQHQAKDEQIKKVIVEGGAAAGLDGAMAPNPDLAAKPLVVAELLKRIRSFK